MKNRLLFLLIIFTIFLIVGCKNESDVEEGLPYDEYITKANKAYSENDAEKAISYYKKALAINPTNGKTHYTLGEIYENEYDKSYKIAMDKITINILNNPTPNGVNHRKHDVKNLVQYGLKIDYDELAMQEYRETVKFDPKNWMARYKIASKLFNNKQYKEAIQESERVIELNPKYSNAYSLVGEAYLESGSLERAVKYINKAIEYDPRPGYNYYNLGLVYRKMNNGEKANEILNKLKKMNSIYYDKLRLSLYR